MNELHRELARVGIRGRLARRIELELEDHRRCDPGAELGEPALIAERFAAELRIVRTRRASLGTFGALVLVAASLGVFSVSIGYRGAGGWAAALSGVGLAACCQIALVAGTLALVRGWRAKAAADLRLVQRRAFVALCAGGGVSASLAVQGVALHPLLALVAALVPVPALAAAAVAAHSAAALTPAGGLAETELPRSSLLALGTLAVALVTLGGAIAERSLVEGAVPGALEGAGLLAAVLVFGRLLALRR